MALPEDLRMFALRLADASGGIARQYFRQPFDIITKADESPVTVADRTIEQTLRDMIATARPEDGILGEEFGAVQTRNGYTWVIDPIDGTKAFTIGRPTFGTLIGLCFDGRPVLGVIDQPISRERWIGIEGEATTFNGATVRTRPCPALKQAIFAVGSIRQVSDKDPDRFSRLEAACRYAVFQSDCYAYGLMASGFLDIAVEAHLGVYDYIALVPVIEGAGGKITDWAGKPLTLESGDTCLATGDATLHDQVLALLRPASG